jgi:hypothetical protein
VLAVVAGVAVVAAVAGAAVPAAVPPPSKEVVDPYIPDGKIPTDEHDVPPLVMAPLVGIEMVPVAPVGNGLTPGDISSVAPNGTPVGPTDPPAPIPNGEVAPTEGIAESGSVGESSTWANAGLVQSNGQAAAMITKSLMENPRYEPSDYAARRSVGAVNSGPTESLGAGRTAAINENFIAVLRLQTALLATSACADRFDGFIGTRLSNINQSLWRMKRREMLRMLLRVHGFSLLRCRWLT